MNTKKLKQLVLDLAIHGKLVPQDPNDEPASVLLERIKAEKSKTSKGKKTTNSSDNLDEVPFDVPEGWVWTRLGNVISVKSGMALNVRNIDGGEFPIYGGNGINGYHDCFNVDEQTLLIGRVGFYCGSIHKTISKSWVTDNALIVSHENVLFTDYLYWSLIWMNLGSTSNSTAQPVVSGKGILPLSIPLPPLSEQKRIVAEIEKWFAIIDELEENATDLKKSVEQAKRKVLDLAIHGKLVEQDPNDEPASVLLERIKAEKSKTQKGKKSSIPSDNLDEVPFDVPEGWCWCTILDISEDDLGKTLDREKNKGIYKSYLRSANVLWDKFDFSDMKEMKFEDSELDFYSLKKGDLLICEGGDIGRAAVWNENKEMYFQNALHRLRFYNDINPYLFMYFLYYYKKADVLDVYSQGVTIKHLTKTSLSKIPFPLPPLSEQERIVRKIEEVFGELDRIEEMIG